MKLYTNGCSFVWGDELEDRENKAFPFLLQKKLNCELIDNSRCASDNQRILRDALTRDLTDHFVIIGWTLIFRYEYYDLDYDGPNKYIIDGGKWVTHTPNIKEYKKFGKYFTYDWFVINFVNQVVALQNHLKYYKIPFFFFMSYPIFPSWPLLNLKEGVKANSDIDRIRKYLYHFDLIDESTFPSIFNQDLTFSDYCINNGLNNFMPKLHPTKEQHKLWSEYLYEKIRVLE
jgi:hypothetical protein|tara:strand:- start:479 stop:1171 length:693 start_codon:yes stop_codon:yes gene_type:complete